MTTKNKAIIYVASLTTIGAIIFFSLKKHKDRKKQQILEEVADEGYETAYDVLYPLKKNRIKRFFN